MPNNGGREGLAFRGASCALKEPSTQEAPLRHGVTAGEAGGDRTSGRDQHLERAREGDDCADGVSCPVARNGRRKFAGRCL